MEELGVTFLDKERPFGKSIKVPHTIKGLCFLEKFLKKIKNETGQKPSVVLDSTGYYQTSVVQVDFKIPYHKEMCIHQSY